MLLTVFLVSSVVEGRLGVPYALSLKFLLNKSQNSRDNSVSDGDISSRMVRLDVSRWPLLLWLLSSEICLHFPWHDSSVSNQVLRQFFRVLFSIQTLKNCPELSCTLFLGILSDRCWYFFSQLFVSVRCSLHQFVQVRTTSLAFAQWSLLSFSVRLALFRFVWRRLFFVRL